MWLQPRQLLIKLQLNKQLESRCCRDGRNPLPPLPFWLCAPRVRFSAYPRLQPCLSFEAAQAVVLLGFWRFVFTVRATSRLAHTRLQAGISLPSLGLERHSVEAAQEIKAKGFKKVLY